MSHVSGVGTRCEWGGVGVMWNVFMTEGAWCGCCVGKCVRWSSRVEQQGVQVQQQDVCGKCAVCRKQQNVQVQQHVVKPHSAYGVLRHSPGYLQMATRGRMSGFNITGWALGRWQSPRCTSNAAIPISKPPALSPISPAFPFANRL